MNEYVKTSLWGLGGIATFAIFMTGLFTIINLVPKDIQQYVGLSFVGLMFLTGASLAVGFLVRMSCDKTFAFYTGPNQVKEKKKK